MSESTSAPVSSAPPALSLPNVPALSLPSVPCVAAPADHSRWFATEVHAHDAQLKSHLRGKFPTIRSDVDDIAQEAYLKLLRRHVRRPIDSVKGFLFKVARNLALDLLRKHRRSPISSLSSDELSRVIEERPSVSDALSDQEKFEVLVEAISHLPDRCYEVIQLHKFDGLSQREVAQKLGLSVRTVENHTRLALKRIENHLRQKGVTSLD